MTTASRYVYETEFVQVDGPPLTMKGIVVHMEADSYEQAEREAWNVVKFWLKPELHEWVRVRHTQAIREIRRTQERRIT